MGHLIATIPYKSQYDADAGQYRNDCGPACVAMILNGLDKEVTTNAVFRRSGAEANSYVSVSQMIRAAQTYKVTFKYFYPWSLNDLKLAVKSGKAPIVLVHYGAWSSTGRTQSKFTGPHFVVVVGYDDTHIYVNDPLWKDPRRYEGERIAWTIKEFMTAWTTASKDGNRNYSGIYCTHALPVDTFGVGGEPQPIQPEPEPEPEPEPPYQIDPGLKRRIMAWAAFFGVPLNDLTTKAVVAAYEEAMGDWGLRVELHEVASEDTLPLISLKYYGDPKYWDVLVYFNGLEFTDAIHDGDVMSVPEPLAEPVEIPVEERPIGRTFPYHHLLRGDRVRIMPM